MATTTSKSGLSEYLHFCRSLQEYQQLKLLEKVERLFLQISKIDDQFRITFQDKMKTIDHLDRRQVLDDYSNKVPINEILLGHPKFDNRTFTQVFAEKFKTDKLKVFHDFDVFSFLKSCEISCWTLFRTSELIKDQPNPTAASICDILTGMAMLPSQMVVVLALIIVFISEWKLLVDNLDKLRQLEALFQNLAPENNLIFNLEYLFENILNLEDETGNPDKETVEMVDELTKYLKALDDEKKDFTENLNIAMKRVESELPQPDIIIEKVVQGNNKHVEKTNMETNSLQNLVEGLKKQSWEIADGTVLFNKIMNVQNGIDVYVQVIHNGDTNILLGTIKDIRKDPRGMKKETFYIHIKDRTLIRISEVQVERSKLGFANSWTTMIYPRGTRVMAIFYPRTRDEEIEYKKGEKLSQWLPGIIGGFDRKHKEYLVFFDIDIDAYIDMNKVRLHFDQTIIEKENGELIVEVRENYKKVNDKGRSEFLKKYLCDKQAPQIHDGRIGESLRAKDSRRTYKATIIKIERLLYLLRFPKNDRISYNDQGLNCSEFNCTKHNHSDKWIYRGSTTRLDIQEMNVKLERRKRHVQQQEIMRKTDDDEKFTRQIARKSTNNFQTNLSGSTTTIISDGNIKNRKTKSTKVERKSLKSPNWSKILIWNNHEKCSKKCLELNQKTIQEHVKNLNYPKIVSPFFKPILNGWTRIIVNSTTMKSKRSMSVKRDRKDYVNYISPCGTRFYDITDIDNYLKETNSPLPIMWFTMFSCVDPETVIEVPKQFLIDPDFSLGMEGVPIPVVNAIDRQPKPKMIYNSTRFARNEKVNQVLENSRQARSCCSCIDDCSNVEQCECQQLTIKEHSRLNPQLQGTIKNYDHGSLHQRIQSAVYECNSKCLCNKDKCCNYISQRKIEIPIQLFQTAQSGWGVRTLVDIPTGMFVSTYAGEILTDEMADKIAEEYGNGRDMYYADLDFLESMENEKINRGFDLPDDGIEEDLPTNDSANLTKYFKNESLFLVDAFNEGNIGRFYNHSCDPNLFVQNIFTDTHDMRFPVMAFFSLKDVAAGAELTWDYNYIVTDSTVKCHCGSSNCRGFLM